MHLHSSNKYQIQIPRKAQIGAGLYLRHATTISDNVYIGPNVCLIENVVIGNNVTIGAGSIVTKNIEENATAVGTPAKVINFNAPAQYIRNKIND